MAMPAVSPPLLGMCHVHRSRPNTLRSLRTFTLAPLENDKNANVGCKGGSKLRSKGVLVLSKAAVGTEDFTIEPTTNVKFLSSLTAPGSLSTLSLVGMGFREKKIAIIGVKLYAVALYVDVAIRSYLATCNGKLGSQIEENSSFFKAVAEAPVEKSLQIVLVRNIDGETFWGALDEAVAVSPRLKSVGPAEQKALASFHKTFQGRPLKQGTIIQLTWVQSSMMLVSISSDGSPSTVDGAIDSVAVASALFDVYFGSNPVCPSLKKSVASRLAEML